MYQYKPIEFDGFIKQNKMAKNKIIEVQQVAIALTDFKGEDYICITDMAKAKTDESRAADVIKNWIRTRTT